MAESAIVSLSVVLAFINLNGFVGLPLGVPPLPEDPRMAQVAPEECLYYTTWRAMGEPGSVEKG